MSRLRLWFVFCALVSLFAGAEDKLTLSAPVPPDYKQGVQAQYLQYLADKLGAELKLFPMPIPRRLIALRSGEIDIMVGLRAYREEAGFLKLQPSYESVDSAFFILADKIDSFTQLEQGKKLSLALTIDGSDTLDWARENFLQISAVPLIQQKIDMLKLGRVDLFFHLRMGALKKLDELGLQDKIVESKVLSPIQYQHHVGLSKKSPWYKHATRIERVIQDGVQSGDFARIRAEYEAFNTR